MLGLSNLYYNRALMIAGSASPALGTLLSAHQSTGVPQPLAFARDRPGKAALPAPLPAPVTPDDANGQARG